MDVKIDDSEKRKNSTYSLSKAARSVVSKGSDVISKTGNAIKNEVTSSKRSTLEYGVTRRTSTTEKKDKSAFQVNKERDRVTAKEGKETAGDVGGKADRSKVTLSAWDFAGQEVYVCPNSASYLVNEAPDLF